MSWPFVSAGTLLALQVRAMDRHLQQRILRRAAEIVGGVDALCHLFDVEPQQLQFWLDGKASPPPQVAGWAIDLVLKDDVARALQDRRHSPRHGAAA